MKTLRMINSGRTLNKVTPFSEEDLQYNDASSRLEEVKSMEIESEYLIEYFSTGRVTK